MADTVEKIIFDDSQAQPVIKGLTESIQASDKAMKQFNNTLSNETTKAANQAAVSEAKLNEAMVKRTLSMREARAELGNQVKQFGAFGITIGGGIEKLREMKDMLSLFRQGFIGSIQATETQKQGIETLSKVFGGGKNAITGFVGVMNTVRVAILSTGIGALIIALGSLITYFTATSEGSDYLAKKFAGFKAAFRVVTDAVASVGGAIFKAFDDPKKAVSDLYEAIKTNLINRVQAIPLIFGAIGESIKNAFSGNINGAKENIKDMGQALIQFGTGLDKAQQGKIATALGNVVDEAAKAQKRGEELWQRQDDLYNQETAQILKLASLRRQLAEQRLIASDTEKTFTERINASKKAIETEAKILDTEVAIAKQKAAIIREQNALKGLGATSEDKRALAEAEAEVIKLETESVTKKRALFRQLQGLENEKEAFLKAQADKLKKVYEQISGLAGELGLISSEQQRIKNLKEQQTLLNSQVQTLKAMATLSITTTGINPFIKDIQLAEELLQRLEAEIRKVPELEPIGQATNQEVKKLQQEIERLKQIAVDFNIDTSKAQENLNKKIKEITTKGVKSTAEKIKIDLPLTVNPVVEDSFSIYEAIERYLEDVDDAKGLLEKALKDIFGEVGGEQAAQFLGSLNEGFNAYSSVLQESLGLQIQANNELIKQRQDQRKKLEDELNYELELQKEGLANNVGTKQQEVNDLLAEEERYQKENEELKRRAARNQLIADTIQQTASLVTSSINIIKGFSNIPIVGLPLGIAAVGALLAFFAKTKAQAFAATKLHTGAKRIDDHFGFVDRYGDTDLGGGAGYSVVNAATGKDTGVRISGREMLLKQRESILHENFLMKFSKGYYNNLDLEAMADHYSRLGDITNKGSVNQTILNIPVQKQRPVKQWVPFTDKKGRTRAKLLTIREDQADGSEIIFDV